MCAPQDVCDDGIRPYYLGYFLTAKTALVELVLLPPPASFQINSILSEKVRLRFLLLYFECTLKSSRKNEVISITCVLKIERDDQSRQTAQSQIRNLLEIPSYHRLHHLRAFRSPESYWRVEVKPEIAQNHWNNPQKGSNI